MKKFSFPSIAENLTVVLAFLMPLFFLPFTTDLFDMNKRFLFIAVTAVMIIIGSVRILMKGEINLTRNPWTIPVTIFFLATLATIILVSPNKVMALLGSGGLYLTFSAFILVATSLVQRGFTGKLVAGLSMSAVVVTLLSLVDRFALRITGVLNSSFGLSIPEGTHFFVTGSPLFTVFFLVVVGAMIVAHLLQNRAQKKQNFLQIIFAVICAVGILLNAEALLPGRPTSPQFLSILDSWSVSTDVLKTPVNAALGVGTDSYASAFSIFRPQRTNEGPLWFVRFNNARNTVLELLTTQGVFGMAAFILIVLTSIRLIRTAREDNLALGVGTLVIEAILLLFPPNVLLISLLAIFITAWGASLKERGIHSTESVFSFFALADFSAHPALARQKGQKIMAKGFSGALIIATLVLFFLLGKAYAAEVFFAKSISAAQKGNGQETYDFAVKAITNNPFMENYHRAFAITNLSIAQGLSQKKDLSDADKQNVLTLIQQAIQQAKIAANLNPLDTANWDSLTNIYSALIGSAEGADQWTIASFVEQIKTDPANPQVRFNMASVYRTLGNDDMALQLFQQAVQLKPDFANAYFNMADIFKKKGDKVNELAMLQATIALIKPEQPGYSSVMSRIEELQKPAAATAPTQETKAAKPTPTPTPSVSEVDLPSAAGLPESTTVPEVPQQ